MAMQIVEGVTLVEAEPGAPPPPGVPPTAIRCELVEVPDLSPRWRPWMIRGGATVALGSGAALGFSVLWATIPFIAALAVLWYAVANPTSTTVMPSETGRYLGFEAVEDDEEGSGGQAVFARLVAIVVGTGMVGGSIFQLASAERVGWMGLGMMGVLGCYFLYLGITGNAGDNEPREKPSTLRFRALADPTRPLAAADPQRPVPPPAPELNPPPPHE